MLEPRLHSVVRDARLRGMFAGVLAFLLVAFGAANARDISVGGAREYGVKAAFVYNFTKFIEWPPESFASRTSPFVIGVLGSEPLLPELEKAVRGRKIDGRTIVIQGLRDTSEVASPHVLFVGGAAGLTSELAQRIATRPILTVGESPDFLEQGGVIGFVFEGDKLRFRIEMGAAGRAKLRISAQLQKLAQSVQRKD